VVADIDGLRCRSSRAKGGANETETLLEQRRGAPSDSGSRRGQRCTPASPSQEAQRGPSPQARSAAIALSVFWLRPRAFSNLAEWQGVGGRELVEQTGDRELHPGESSKGKQARLEALGAQRFAQERAVCYEATLYEIFCSGSE